MSRLITKTKLSKALRVFRTIVFFAGVVDAGVRVVDAFEFVVLGGISSEFDGVYQQTFFFIGRYPVFRHSPIKEMRAKGHREMELS